MNRRQSVRPIMLDDLVGGRLPRRIVKAIGEMELTVDEMISCETDKPGIRMAVTKKDLLVEVRFRVPLKAILGAVGGLIGTIGWAFRA